MKLLILAFLSTSLFAQTMEERLGDLEDLRLAMHKCNFKVANPALFKKKLMKDKDLTKLAALEACDASSQVELAAEKTEKQNRKTAIQNMISRLKNNTATDEDRNLAIRILVEKLLL